MYQNWQKSTNWKKKLHHSRFCMFVTMVFCLNLPHFAVTPHIRFISLSNSGAGGFFDVLFLKEKKTVCFHFFFVLVLFCFVLFFFCSFVCQSVCWVVCLFVLFLFCFLFSFLFFWEMTSRHKYRLKKWPIGNLNKTKQNKTKNKQTENKHQTYKLSETFVSNIRNWNFS